MAAKPPRLRSLPHDLATRRLGWRDPQLSHQRRHDLDAPPLGLLEILLALFL